MSVLEKIAYYRNRRDEVPNQELANIARNVETPPEINPSIGHRLLSDARTV